MVRQEGRGEDRRQVGLNKMRRQKAKSGMLWLLKRWWFWVGMLFVAIPVVSGYVLFSTDDSPINRAICEKIQLGWTFEPVVAILPPESDMSVDAYDVLDEVLVIKWTDYLENQITVRFETEKGFWRRGESKVTDKKFVPSQLSFAEQMKRRIERRIRALWP